MKKELCIDSYEGLIIAKKYGFDSVELNSSLSLGGITPSMALIKEVCENKSNVEVICMVRNRGAGFLYTDEEYDMMLKELDLILEENVDGIAFGFLTENYQIDLKRTKEFVDKIHKKGKKAVFHRAFDNSKDYKKSLQDLIYLGVDRLLTSGQERNAIEGAGVIKNLIQISEGEIEILAGAGINSINLKSFVNFTKANYIHTSCKGFREDITTNVNVSFQIYDNNKYQVTDEKEVERFVLEFKKLGE